MPAEAALQQAPTGSPRDFSWVGREALTTEALREILHEGLCLARVTDTAENLGDRSTYVGASDIAGDCERMAFLDKTAPGTFGLGTLIRFIRGHLAEAIFKRALDALGIPFRHQDELVLRYQGVPFRIHPDFLLFGKKVLEIKCGDVPSSPYESWTAQVNFQISSMTEARGEPHEGYVVATDLAMAANRQVRVYGPFRPDPARYLESLERGKRLWECMTGDRDPRTLAARYGPLCAWCRHRQGCPELSAETVPYLGMEEDLESYFEIQASMRALEAEKGIFLGRLREALANVGGRGTSTGALAVMRSRRQRNVNWGRLERDFPQAYRECVETTRVEYPEVRATG